MRVFVFKRLVLAGVWISRRERGYPAKRYNRIRQHHSRSNNHINSIKWFWEGKGAGEKDALIESPRMPNQAG
jgi:hypothetical protein